MSKPSSEIAPYTKEEIYKADVKMGRFLLDAAYYSAWGLLYGAVGSLFFIKKARIANYCLGFGFGYAVYLHFPHRYKRALGLSNVTKV